MSNFFKCIRPKYLHDFQCDGKACGSKCCGDWRITIDPETIRKYDNMEPREEGQEILSHIIFRKEYQSFGISLQKNYRCPFLGSDYLCKIQKRYGEDYISDICATYPRVFYLVGNMIEESLAMTCPIAAKQVLLSGTDIQFEAVELPYPRKTQIIDWTKHVEVFPDCWHQIQKTCIRVLQNKGLTMDARLLRMLVILEQIDRLEAEAVPDWIDESEATGFSALDMPETSFAADRHIEFMAKLFEKLYSMDMTDQKRKALKNVYLGNVHTLLAEILERYAMPIENYVVNEFFLRFFPFAFTGSLLHNGKIFVISFKLAELFILLTAVSQGGRLNEGDFIQMVDRISERLDHSRDGMTFVRESIGEEPLGQSVKDFAAYMLNLRSK